MTKLEIAKEVIKEYYPNGDCGLFNSSNILGDPMVTLYNKDGLTIDICYYYSYFEVFGLSNEEFQELSNFYRNLEVEE